jgi:hypothetical protein
MSEFSLQMRSKCPYLFPFSTSCQKSDQSRRNPQALSDLGSMVDELVGTELENKQAPNEGGDIEANIVVVDHVEKSVIACGAQRERRGLVGRRRSRDRVQIRSATDHLGRDYWLCGVRRFTNHKGPE